MYIITINLHLRVSSTSTINGTQNKKLTQQQGISLFIQKI